MDGDFIYDPVPEEKVEQGVTLESRVGELEEALARTRTRDLILGWTSQGIHKDELEMRLGEYPLKRVGSQGQQKTFLLAMKLGQALYLSDQQVLNQQSILLLDDIFDKLDSRRVERIVSLVAGEGFGQIFITDVNREHIDGILEQIDGAYRLFEVESGCVNMLKEKNI